MSVADFDRWADDFTAEWVRGNPQLATQKQYFDGDEQDALDRRLGMSNFGGTSIGATAKRQAALARRGLDELRSFSRAELTSGQQTSAAVIEARLNDVIAGAEFAQHRFIFNQIIGLHVSLVAFLTNLHPLRNRRDADNYLARLALVAGLLDEGIAESRAADAAGITPPRFILERTIAQLDGLLAGAPADHVLVSSFARRLAGLADVSSDASQALVARAAEELTGSVLPALARVRGMLAEQLPHSTDAAGAWCLPDGEAFYACELAGYTGSSLSPDEIHAIGLREVARIEAEMDTALKQLGYPSGSINERVEQLNATLQFPADPDPREAIVAHVKAVIEDAERRCELAFDLRPKAPVTVVREPAFSEKSAAAHYSPPAPDGSSPGIYWIPLADVGPNVPWLGIGLKSTAYHEAVPGHHFQLTVEQEAEGLPHFRKRWAFGYDASYAEGWALYSEQLADENDWYADDLPARLGYLSSQLFRARRLVVDTGLHHLKWSREQAIDYGFTVAEIERYVVWPGQACSYMIGQLRILEIRERARTILGDGFSIKEFHNFILSSATMPLDVLEREVTAWATSRHAQLRR